MGGGGGWGVVPFERTDQPQLMEGFNDQTKVADASNPPRTRVAVFFFTPADYWNFLAFSKLFFPVKSKLTW